MPKSANGVSERHRIAVVDDHPIVRTGVVFTVQNETDMEVCGEASTAEEALRMVKATEPDLVIADLSLPGKNGLELIKDLRAAHPNLPIVVLSLHDEILYGHRALKAGAAGYLMKDAASASLIKAIRRVLAGNIYVSPALNNTLVASFTARQGAGSPLRALSDRELEVFELIGRGTPPEVIAQNLHISVRTVDAHRTNIRKKLKLSDSVALLCYAVRWVESGNEDIPSD